MTSLFKSGLFVSKSALQAITLACGVLSSAGALAVPEQCIQDPLRSDPCPHTIYKTAELPNDETGEEETQLICICITDFQDLFIPADSEVKRRIQAMNLRSLTAQLGISEEKLREILKYD